jgi:hypothetical protein
MPESAGRQTASKAISASIIQQFVGEQSCDRLAFKGKKFREKSLLSGSWCLKGVEPVTMTSRIHMSLIGEASVALALSTSDNPEIT